MTRSIALALLAAVAIVGARPAVATSDVAAQGDAERSPELRTALAAALRAYFDDADARDRGPALGRVRKLAAGKEDVLADVLRRKDFVATSDGPTSRRGRIVGGRFVDDPEAANPAWFYGPESARDASTPPELHPLIVYVPDAIDSAPYRHELRKEGIEAKRFVLLIPDERRDNLWHPGPDQILRHTGPLRDLLLNYPIDPDRVYFVGSGRGGHACWDVGLMRSERWAGIYPCNGGLIHEGGFAATGGVFVENAKNLTVFTVYNTTFDHGIESCRYAGSLLKKWGTRFQRVEEQRLRVMGLAEAMTKLSTVKRRAHPRSITKRFNRLLDGSHYWLQAKKRRPRVWDPTARIKVRGDWPSDPKKQREVVWKQVQRQCARLHGTVAGNAMRIETQGVSKLRVWLDSERIDFDRSVQITCNGKAQRAKKPKRKLEVMLARVHATGDTERLYWDYADLTVR